MCGCFCKDAQAWQSRAQRLIFRGRGQPLTPLNECSRMLQTQERYLFKTLDIPGVSPHFTSDGSSSLPYCCPKDSASDHLLGSRQGASFQASHPPTPHHVQMDDPQILLSNQVPQLSEQSGCPGASPPCTPALPASAPGGWISAWPSVQPGLEGVTPSWVSS